MSIGSREAAAVAISPTDLPSWDTLASRPGADLESCSRELAYLAIDATRRAAYFNARALGSSHGRSARAANLATRSLADSLGFTYPTKFDVSLKPESRS